jgi:hypothetical protein
VIALAIAVISLTVGWFVARSVTAVQPGAPDEYGFETEGQPLSAMEKFGARFGCFLFVACIVWASLFGVVVAIESLI